jgi:hypothetical protein
MVADRHEPPAVDARSAPELGQMTPRARSRDDRQVREKRDRRISIGGLATRNSGPTHPSRSDRENVERIGCRALDGEWHAEQCRRGQMAEDLVIAHQRKKRCAAVDEIREVERPCSHTVVRPVEVAPAHPSVLYAHRPALRNGERETRRQVARQRHTSTHRATLPLRAALSRVIHNRNPSNCHKTLDLANGCSGL